MGLTPGSDGAVAAQAAAALVTAAFDDPVDEFLFGIASAQAQQAKGGLVTGALIALATETIKELARERGVDDREQLRIMIERYLVPREPN